MKTTTRYSLIIFGFIVFLIIAPLLVLYVSGRKLDIGDRNTSATGILDAKSNPGGADLLINGVTDSSTPSIARFLLQGEYKVSLQKEGYFEWVKNLAIEPGKVTYAQKGVDEIQLIKKSVPKVLVESGVTSFAVVNDAVWYATKNTILKGRITESEPESILPINFTPASIIQLRDGSHILATDAKNNATLVDTNSSRVISLPSNLGVLADINVITNDLILYRTKNSLIAYKPNSKTTTTLRSDITSFTVLDGTGYFATTAGAISSAIWNGTSFVDEQNLISSSPLVSSTSTQLIISDKKVLFFKNGNSDLFRVGNTLDLILNGVVSTKLDLDTDEVTIRTASELWFYNFITNEAQLLNRNTFAINDFSIHSAIGYGFVATSKGLEAIEIDNRDKQNRYQLINHSNQSTEPVWQLGMTVNQKIILALENDSLLVIDVRN